MWKTSGDVVLYYKSNGKKPESGKKAAERSSGESAGIGSG